MLGLRVLGLRSALVRAERVARRHHRVKHHGPWLSNREARTLMGYLVLAVAFYALGLGIAVGGSLTVKRGE